MLHLLSKLILAAGILTSLAMTAGPAAAISALYAADGSGCGSLCNLYTLDPATGTVLTTIGPIGTGVTGLAFNPVTGQLYGASNNNASGPSSLLTIDPTTGQGTVIGTFSSTQLVDIAFDSSANLYGWSRTGDLYSVNLTTGAATQVGDALGTLGTRGGLAIDATNNIFALGGNNLYRIDNTTGALLSALPVSGPGGAIGSAMDFDESGTLFVFDPSANTLDTINTTTGAVTVIGGSLPGNLDALAFQRTASVPEPSSLLLLCLGLMGLVFWRRKRAA